MEFFLAILLFVADFFLTSAGFFILTLALSIFDIIIIFTWGKSFAFWVCCVILRALLR